ncbi:hypothetical protein [Bradyrhizobium sp. SZCCHNR1045]|uniref:hypothetical protein n=1 Tax=Bradyrhizobium sp. SZCCHNR1045 TaxID=3057353 RepID=UPI0029170900|nr:hypothetical protein [Bradyrhizobium sp. SZCCHNR1045]
MATLSVEIEILAHERDDQSRVTMRHILGDVLQAIGDGKSTGGSLKDRERNVVGSWRYEGDSQ